jgi:hypothetical protein
MKIVQSMILKKNSIDQNIIKYKVILPIIMQKNSIL